MNAAAADTRHAPAGHEHGHDHGVSADADRRYLTLALALLLGFMGAEIVVGILASSLALISDAGHMFTDAGAVGLSLWTIRAAARPPAGDMTFGLRRLEVLSAQINGITLVAVAAWFLFEAVQRLVAPPEVDAVLVTATALVGIPVNLAAVWAVSRANRRSLNVEGSFQHLLTDLYAFIATAVAGGLILATGWNRLDSVAAIVVALLMLRAGIPLLAYSTRIMLQAAPRNVRADDVGQAVASTDGVVEVHDVHVWELTPAEPMLSAHVLVRPEVDCHATRTDLEAMLADRFAIAHTTLQMEHSQHDERVGVVGPGCAGSHEGERCCPPGDHAAPRAPRPRPPGVS